MASVSSDGLEQAESQLRRAWNLLPAWKQAKLQDEQRRWTEIKDGSSDQVKLDMIRKRTIYLLKN
jgi:hypothetical protein